MMVIILVQLLVEQVEYRNSHHTLVEVRGSVLDNLDGNNFLGLQILTFDHLTERALAKDVQYEIPIFVTVFFIA